MFMMQLIIGCFMIALTVIIHAIALDRLVYCLGKIGPKIFKIFHQFWEIPLMIFTVLGVFLTHVVQIWLWGVLFLYLAPDILPDLESALYFSTSSFTTVGFGDIYLDKEWRLLSSFESANGFILFGWSTAFIFEIISKLYRKESIKKTE
jgi:uncharacterized membrane protein